MTIDLYLERYFEFLVWKVSKETSPSILCKERRFINGIQGKRTF